MSTWRDINSDSWTFTKRLIVGYGGGIGKYQTSYAINEEHGSILNGKLSADLKIANRHSTGAGLICRADNNWTFLGFYTAPYANGGDSTSARIGLFKQGVFSPLATLSEDVFLDEEFNRFSLEFFSGQIRGEIQTSERTYELTQICPHIPFPGRVGLVKFYGTGVTAKNIVIEETDMAFEQKPRGDSFEFDAFICYSSKDRPTIEEITREFKRENIRYWLDIEQIGFGDPVVQKIEDGLRSSKYVIPCIGVNLMKSGWTRAEFSSVLNAEFSGNSDRTVIPLKLDDGSDDEIPLLLRDKKRVAYTNKTEFAEFIKFLKK